MEPAKRVTVGDAWDRLPRQIVSMITVKVAETLEAPLKDLCSLRLCNKAMKSVSSSRVIANCFNLEHHYQSMVWGDGGTLDAYLQTVDWLQGVNNGEALIIKGMGDICTAHPSGVALLARAEEEGDLQAAYVLAVLKYDKHGTTEDVFNHIWCVYGEVTYGS
jgi:hypothetical protein